MAWSSVSIRAPAFFPNVPNCGLVGGERRCGLETDKVLFATDLELRVDIIQDLARVTDGVRGDVIIQRLSVSR